MACEISLRRVNVYVKALIYFSAAPYGKNSLGVDGEKVSQIDAWQDKPGLVLLPSDSREGNVGQRSRNISAGNILRASTQLQTPVVLGLVTIEQHECFPLVVFLADVAYVGKTCPLGGVPMADVYTTAYARGQQAVFPCADDESEGIGHLGNVFHAEMKFVDIKLCGFLVPLSHESSHDVLSLRLRDVWQHFLQDSQRTCEEGFVLIRFYGKGRHALGIAFAQSIPYPVGVGIGFRDEEHIILPIVYLAERAEIFCIDVR